MPTASGSLRQTWTAVRALLVLTVVLGILFPAAVELVGLAMPSQSSGSLMRSSDGAVVGSALIGQSFTTKKGAPLKQWFQSRPSAATAAGPAGYDGGASSGSNLGPNNPDLVKSVRERRAQIAAFEGVSPDRVPADALTSSASGLDPDISVAYADLQVPRVATARGIDEATVRRLVAQSTDPRPLGYLGEPGVNVLRLNLALADLS